MEKNEGMIRRVKLNYVVNYLKGNKFRECYLYKISLKKIAVIKKVLVIIK